MFYIFLRDVEILDAELLAVFEAAGLQNQAPCPATHTSTESVYASAVASFGLVSSFWHIISPIRPVTCDGAFWA